MKNYEVKREIEKFKAIYFVQGYSNKTGVSNSNYFLPFDGNSVNRLMDGRKRAAEVTAKDCLKVVFVPDPLLSPSVRYDVCSTVGTKRQSQLRWAY